MSTKSTVFLDAGILIGALLSGDSRYAEARPIVEAARRGDLLACTSVGVLAEVYAALTWVGAQPPQTPQVASNVVNLLVVNPSAIQVLETTLDAGLKMLERANSIAPHYFCSVRPIVSRINLAIHPQRRTYSSSHTNADNTPYPPSPDNPVVKFKPMASTFTKVYNILAKKLTFSH